jgi:uncharacterized membrane protein YfcA
VGVEGGVAVAERVPEGILQRLFGALMILVAAQIALRAGRRTGRRASDVQPERP